MVVMLVSWETPEKIFGWGRNAAVLLYRLRRGERYRGNDVQRAQYRHGRYIVSMGDKLVAAAPVKAASFAGKRAKGVANLTAYGVKRVVR